ncbi:MAG: UDP-N-acetylglucosamine 2-epimerase (non-hydrolyzing) [Mycobacterium sp.]
MAQVHLIAGTRPEAIKLAPLVPALRDAGLEPFFVASGQHPTMVHQALASFGMRPDVSLEVVRSTGTQPELMAGLTLALERLWASPPDAVVVQGDTTTVLAAAMVAFWAKIPVVHLEAGLRSHDLAAPFPEEGNRRLVGQVASLHLAPTPAARDNLLRENIDTSDVLVTGNTVVDAVLEISSQNHAIEDPTVAAFVARAEARTRRLLLVTVHRRESWGAPLDRVLGAVRRLLDAYPDVEVVLPTHPNPAVGQQVHAALGGHPRACITPPLDYPVLVRVLAAATLALSDSGGIQEEAPTFGVPVLVLREVTERMEAVDYGCARLMGTDADAITAMAARLLDDPAERAAMVSLGNPFGDGKAAERSAAGIAWMLGELSSPPVEFGI